MSHAQLITDFNNARTNDDRATVITNYILTYRRNIAPGTAAISNCLFFNASVTPQDRKYILNKVRRGVVAALQFDYPEIDNTNLGFDFDKLEELSNNFDQSYLTSKKWQSQHVLFDSNILATLNMVPKIPINFAGRVTPVDYNDKSNITVSTVRNSEYISNSAQFYIDPQQKHLFSTVTTLTFTPVSATYAAANPAHLSATTLMNDANFTRQLDVCTYVIPEGDPNRAINIIRYDGTGFPHNNQVFYSPQHQRIIGLRAEVPHFHFPSHIEALLYTKKQSANPADKGFTSAGCNAISCKQLQQYLQYLDGLTETQLQNEKSYNMPFLLAKTSNVTYNLNIKQVLNNYVNTARHTELTVNTMRHIEDLYREMQYIQNPLSGSADNPQSPTPPGTNPSNNPNVGPLITNPTINIPDVGKNKPPTKTSSFSDLIVALGVLQLVHDKQEAEKNSVVKAEMVALEAVVAKSVIESMSFIINNVNQPTLKKDEETMGV